MEIAFIQILGFVFGSLFTMIITQLNKKKEQNNEAKKVFLQRRIERNENLYQIFSEGQIISWMPGDKVYYQIFESPQKMNIWFDKLIIYANSNSLYCSKDVHLELSFLSNLFKQINKQIQVEKYNDLQLKQFSNKYYIELQAIFSNVSSTILTYFEKEISLDYKLNKPSNKEYESNLNRINRLKLITENGLNQTHIE